MHPAIRKDWEKLVESLFKAEISASERVLALHELANSAEILASDVRRNSQQKERGLA